MVLQQQADELVEYKPEIVTTVYKQAFPDLRRRIQNIEPRGEDMCDDYEEQYGQVLKYEEEIRDFGYVKLTQKKYESLIEQMDTDDKQFNALVLDHQKLDGKYEKLKESYSKL